MRSVRLHAFAFRCDPSFMLALNDASAAGCPILLPR